MSAHVNASVGKQKRDRTKQSGKWLDAIDDYCWAFASCPHIPGENKVPDKDDEVYRIAHAAPDPTDPGKWRQNEAWLAGLWLFDKECFWEAHAVWEPVWMNSRPNSAERMLAHGLIQFATARLKIRMGRPQAAWRLARMARIYCAEARRGAGNELMGLDLVALMRSIDTFLCTVDRALNRSLTPVH